MLVCTRFHSNNYCCHNIFWFRNSFNCSIKENGEYSRKSRQMIKENRVGVLVSMHQEWKAMGVERPPHAQTEEIRSVLVQILPAG